MLHERAAEGRESSKIRTKILHGRVLACFLFLHVHHESLIQLALLSGCQTDLSSLYVLFVWSLCPGENSLVVVLSSVKDLLPSGILGLAWF